MPPAAQFKPLMTIYLTDETDRDDLAEGHKAGIVTAAKLYPAHATTHAEHGVTNIRAIYPVLERMQQLGMPLLVHGEVTDQDVDIFDREAVFIEKVLIPLRKDLPHLRIVLEHITTEDAAAYVESEGTRGPLAATITAHHLYINRSDIFKGGLRPHFYCLPVAKREHHRQALIKAATSNLPMFFLGTDTAPHSRKAKECACGSAGIFTAPHALSLYLEAFLKAGALDHFEDFSSINGPLFYQLPVNSERVTLERVESKNLAIKPILTEDEQQIVFFDPLPTVSWKEV
jgi:dihydroorotase